MRAGLGVLLLFVAATASCRGSDLPGAAFDATEDERPRDPDASTSTPPVAGRCAPTGGDPRWLEESESVEVRLSCATGLAGPEISFEVTNLPAGASLTADLLRWTTRLDDAGVYLLDVREVSTSETGVVKIGVADRFDDPNNASIRDPARYSEEYGLPVFHLDFEGRLSSWQYAPAKLTYRGHTYEIQAKYRGATSLDFPKRSYTFEFRDEDEFRDPKVGFGHRDKLVLITSFNDNSYVRPRLAFDAWNRMDPEHVQVKTFFAVLVVNGHWRGVYTAADRVDSDLMRRSGLDPSGNLYKAFHADANFTRYMTTGEEKWSLHQGYEKKEGTPPHGESGAYDDIIALNEFVISSSGADFEAGLGERVKLREYEDWWIFVTMLMATDSAGKNAYHYHDPKGGPFRYVPWDLDATLGQAWDTARVSPQWLWDAREKNGLFQRMLDTSAIARPMRDRYESLVREQLPEEWMLERLDALHSEVHAAALRDERRWGAEYRAFERWSHRGDLLSHEEEFDYVRDWVRTRWRTLRASTP